VRKRGEILVVIRFSQLRIHGSRKCETTIWCGETNQAKTTLVAREFARSGNDESGFAWQNPVIRHAICTRLHASLNMAPKTQQDLPAKGSGVTQNQLKRKRLQLKVHRIENSTAKSKNARIYLEAVPCCADLGPIWNFNSFDKWIFYLRNLTKHHCYISNALRPQLCCKIKFLSGRLQVDL